MFILLGDDIATRDLEVAEYFLNAFYEKFAEFYGMWFFYGASFSVCLTWNSIDYI